MKFLEQRDLREKRLHEEMEKEKRLFVQASKRATQAIQRDLILEELAQSLPFRNVDAHRDRGFRRRICFSKVQSVLHLTLPLGSTSLKP